MQCIVSSSSPTLGSGPTLRSSAALLTCADVAQSFGDWVAEHLQVLSQVDDIQPHATLLKHPLRNISTNTVNKGT